MKTLVAYIGYAPAPIASELKKLLGEHFASGPLPFLGPTIEPGQEDEYRFKLTDLLTRCSPGSAVVFHDETNVGSASAEDALRRATQHEETKRLQADFEVVQDRIETKAVELDRCWAVLVLVKDRAGMPPGLVLLVDKATLDVFPRRLVDLGHLFFDWEQPPAG